MINWFSRRCNGEQIGTMAWWSWWQPQKEENVKRRQQRSETSKWWWTWCKKIIHLDQTWHRYIVYIYIYIYIYVYIHISILQCCAYFFSSINQNSYIISAQTSTCLVQVQNLMGGRLKAAVTGSAPRRKTVKKMIHYIKVPHTVALQKFRVAESEFVGGVWIPPIWSTHLGWLVTFRAKIFILAKDL